jgi:hypothetical protein
MLKEENPTAQSREKQNDEFMSKNSIGNSFSSSQLQY